MYTYFNIYAYIYTCLSIYLYMNIYIHLYLYVCIRRYVYVYVHVYMYMNIFIYIYMYMYTYICTFIHKCMWNIPIFMCRYIPMYIKMNIEFSRIYRYIHICTHTHNRVHMWSVIIYVRVFVCLCLCLYLCICVFCVYMRWYFFVCTCGEWRRFNLQMILEFWFTYSNHTSKNTVWVQGLILNTAD